MLTETEVRTQRHGYANSLASNSCANPSEREKLRLLCASRSKEALDIANQIKECLPSLDVQCKHISNGHADPLYGFDASALPDLVLFIQSNTWEQELSEYAERTAAQRPPLVVIGQGHDHHAMRVSMKAGARDYLIEPVSQKELVAAFEPIIKELLDKTVAAPGKITAVINAKGGCGASIIATNIAHVLASTGGTSVGLVDLDIQFGSACQYLDIHPNRSLTDALQGAEELDEYALEGYLVKHESGLKVLSAEANQEIIPYEIGGDRLLLLLELLGKTCRHIILDVPRQINNLTAAAIESANQTLLITEQSIAALYESKRLAQILRRDLGVDHSAITPVVNRYQKNLDISLADIEKALGGVTPVPIVNDYRTITDSLNNGEPVFNFARNAKVSKQLLALSEQVSGYSKPSRKSLFARLRGSF